MPTSLRRFPWLLLLLPGLFFLPYLLKGELIGDAPSLGHYHVFLDTLGRDHPAFKNDAATVDDQVQMAPFSLWIANTLRDGELPLWNPNNGLGIPQYANGLTNYFDLFNLAFFIVPPLWGWMLKYYLQLALMGVGLHWFLRRIGLSATGALCGAIVYQFSGFATYWMHLATVLSMMAYLPFALAGVELWLSRGRLLGAAIPAFFLGLMALGSYVHFTAFGFVITGLYAGARILALKKNPWTHGLVLGSVFAGAILMGAAFYLPFMLHLPQSHRGPVVYAAGFFPAYLSAILFPFPQPRRINDHSPNVVLIGCIGAWLLLGGVLRGRNRFQALFWLGILLLGLCTGIAAPKLVNLLKDQPLLRSLTFLCHIRVLALYAIGAAVLVGIGADRFLTSEIAPTEERKTIRWPLLLAGLPLIASLAALALTLTFSGEAPTSGEPTGHTAFLQALWPSAPIAATLAGLLFVSLFFGLKGKITPPFLRSLTLFLLVAELFIAGWRVLPAYQAEIFFPPTPITTKIQSLQDPENPERIAVTEGGGAPSRSYQLLPYSIQELGLFESAMPKRFYTLWYRMTHQTPPLDTAASNTLVFQAKHFPSFETLATLNVGHILGTAGLWGDAIFRELWKTNLVGKTKECSLLKNPVTPLPRFWTVDQLQLTTEEEALDLLAEGNRDLFATKALIDNEADFRLLQEKISSGTGEIASSGKVMVRSCGTDQAEVTIEAGKPTLLVMNSLYHPGWVAFCKDPLPTFRINYLMEGILVPGSCTVKLFFRPLDFFIGCLISLLMAMTLLGLGLYSLSRPSVAQKNG